jgi:hypothetical protein
VSKLRQYVSVLPFVLAAAALSAAAAYAAVGLGPATKFRARFTTVQPGSASGLVLKTTGKPPSAGTTEPPAVQQTVILPRGTSLHLGRLPQCTASDAAIAMQGAEAACPARTRVGHGGADGLFNGAPVHFDLGIYAVRGHLVFAAEQGGKPLKQSFKGIAVGRRLILRVPTLNGQIAPTAFSARIAARPAGHVWLRTPRRCPASGHWRAVGRFQGVSSPDPSGHVVTPAQVLVDRVPCRAG